MSRELPRCNLAIRLIDSFPFDARRGGGGGGGVERAKEGKGSRTINSVRLQSISFPTTVTVCLGETVGEISDGSALFVEFARNIEEDRWMPRNLKWTGRIPKCCETTADFVVVW